MFRYIKIMGVTVCLLAFFILMYSLVSFAGLECLAPLSPEEETIDNADDECPEHLSPEEKSIAWNRLFWGIGDYAGNNKVDNEKSECPERIPDEEIMRIVKSEKKCRFGIISNDKDNSAIEIKIKREGCGYSYSMNDLPPRPGGFSMYILDEKWKIISIIPGL